MQPKTLKTSVVLLVNKVHEVHLPVTAEVVPFELSVDQDSVTISCGSFVKQPRPCTFIEIHNPFGRTARFFWEAKATSKGERVASSQFPFEIDCGEASTHSIERGGGAGLECEQEARLT